MKNRILKGSFVWIVTLLISAAAFGQGTTSRMQGTVADGTGAVVSGATVTLTNQGNRSSLKTSTGDSGTFAFDLIPPGRYTVTVEMAGFKKAVSADNAVNVNVPTTLNINLEVGSVDIVVNVENAAELVQTSTSGNIGTTITQQVIESVPIVGLRGRNPLDIVDFQPGVSVGANTGGGVHVNGSRDRSFNYTLDGIDINESSAGGSNFTPLRPNPDSIQEFQIVTANFTAELGRSTGAQVTFVTRSGTNNFHGNIFEYYQTPGVNANEFQNNLLGINKPQFVQHIFGGSFGGPIVNPGFGEGTKLWQLLRDKAFFFVNLQFLRASETRLASRSVYTQAARNGMFRYIQGGRNFPAGNATASVNSSGTPLFPNCSVTVTTNCVATYNVAGAPGGIDPALLAIFNSMPLPNDFAVGDGLNIANFNFNAPQKEKQWDFVTKIDYKANDRNSFFFRYAQGEQNTIGDSVNGGLQTFPDTPNVVNTIRQPINYAFSYTSAPTDNITNELVIGYSEFTFDFLNPAITPGALYSFNLVATPFSNFDRNGRTPSTWQFIDNITFNYQPHLLKFGTNLRLGTHRDNRSSVGGSGVEGIANFSATVNNNFTGFGLPTTGINSNDTTRLRSQINDFLGRVGTYSQAFVSNASGNAFEAPGTRWKFIHKYTELDFFAQDSWRVTRNLLLDIGVRYEVKLSPSSVGLPILAPNQLLTSDGTPSNTIRWEEGSLFPNDYNNFSPSIGFAWDPKGDGKTSIRANYRLAYDRLNSQVNGAQLFQNAPGNNIAVSNTAFGQGGGLLRSGLPVLTPTTSPSVLRQPASFGSGLQTVFDPRTVYPEVHSASASFQRELFWGSVFEFNYIYKRGEHLFGGYNANQVNINARPTGFDSFLNEFIKVRDNPAYNSPLINALYTGNMNTDSGTTTFRTTNVANIADGNVAAAAASISARLSGTQQMIAANGFSPFLFVPFPQFGTVRVLDTNDYSRYHGAQFILKRRMKNGISLDGSYTWSISKDSRSFDPTFSTVSTGTVQSASSTPFDNNNRDLNYAWSDFDRRHIFNLTYIVEAPFGKDRKWGKDMPRALDWLVGGWQLAGLTNYSSGRPFTIYSGLFTFSNSVSTPGNCGGCARNSGTVLERNGTSYFFTAEQEAIFRNSQPKPGEFSSTGRNYFIGSPDFRADVSLSKKFRFNESINLDFRVDAKNVFNAVNYGLPTTTVSSGTFTRIRTSINSSSRRIQFSAKLNF